MQATLFWLDQGGQFWWNPTEAGDYYCGQAQPGRFHGAPIVTCQNVSSTQQRSRSIPLEWNPNLVSGGGPDNPVLYKDIQLGKDVYLNFNGMGPVAKYVTYLNNPTLIPTANTPFLEVPTAHLRASFNRYFTYDAASHTSAEVFPAAGGSIQYAPSSGYGGVIISSSDLSQSLGIYGVHTSLGGSVSYYRVYNFTNWGGTGQFDNGCTKWNAIYQPGDLPAGVQTFNTWILAGSILDSFGYMNSLYAQGVK